MRTIGKFNIQCNSFFSFEANLIALCRVINKENSLVWHQQVLGWLNHYSGSKGSVSLDDTIVPVVDYDP